MRNTHCRNWIVARKLKNVEMRHKHCMTRNMKRKSENVKYEKYKLQDQDFGGKTKKSGK